MGRLRKPSLVILLLVSSSFQFDNLTSDQSTQAFQESRLVATAPGAVPTARSQQAPQQRQEPSGVKAQTSEQKQPDYSKEAYVIERMTTSYRFEKDGTGQRELSVRVRIQSDAGIESFGQLVFSYNSANEKLDIEHVSVRKPDGSEVKAQASAVQDLTAPISREAPVYTDRRQKHVTVPGLRPGDTLEYRVVWRITTPLAPNHFWLEHEFLNQNRIALDERLEVNIPQDNEVKLKTETGLDPVVKEQDGRRVYAWKHANLKREDEEKDNEKKKEDSIGPKLPPIQMTTFKSWDEVGQWYASLQRDRVAADDKIRAKVAEQTRGLNGDLEKVEALYNYVAKNFRYVSLSFGQGRYQPHTATEVFANQYGDCKDKHTLLVSMLQGIGVRAYPALINSSREIDPDTPSPAQFDHVITAIQLGKETLWVDATSEVAPFRLLYPNLRKKQALLIPENAPSRLENTPADPPFPAKVTLDVEGKVDDLGRLSGRSHFAFRGDEELSWRARFRRTPKAEWKRLVEYLYPAGRLVEVTDIRPDNPGATEKPFGVEYDFTWVDFFDWPRGDISFLPPLPRFDKYFADPDTRDGSKPIDLGSPIEITYRLKLSMSARYRIRPPAQVTMTRDYAEYRSSYKLEGNTLSAERSLRLLMREIPASRTQDYLAFSASTRADRVQLVQVEMDMDSAPSIPNPESMTVEELIKAANAFERSGNFAMAEELLKRALVKEPANKLARSLLEYALLLQNKDDAMIEVLREGVKIDPFDADSYSMLGVALRKRGKYEEAEGAFRKTIEISPLNKSARGDLGLVLVELRKYKEAILALEQAISLNADSDDYQIGLGRAYANLGQPEKAVEAFDRAVKLSSDPRDWNKVAYYLSLSNLHLDKAQQYAEMAVNAFAAELRNNDELSTMTPGRLGYLYGIGAYWNTLGLVHFKKGDLDLAEKYVMASWTFGQYSEAGWRLGQISERRGKNEEAVRWYALATAGSRPAPESRENLTRLAGKDKVELLLEKAKAELAEFRTIKLKPLLKDEKEKLEAVFCIVAVPEGRRFAKVTGARFIQGAEKLRPMESALKGAKYPMVFPDKTVTKLFRSGTLTCQPQNGGCSFVLSPLDE